MDASQFYFQFFLARFNANGTPDLTLNAKGYSEFNLFPNANEYGYTPEILANGKILIPLGKPAGFNGIHVLRLNNNGSIDSTFGTNGIANHPVALNTEQTSLAVQTDGKIVIGGLCNNIFPATGNGFFIARFNANGSVDSTFNGVGYVTDALNNSGSTTARKLVIDNTGNSYLCGASIQASVFVTTILSVTANGALNTAFDSDGLLYYNHNQQFTTSDDMVLDANGKLLVCGSCSYGGGNSYRNLVLRLNANGTLDNSFNSNGFFEFQPDTISILTSIAIDKKNKIVLGGSIARNLGASKMAIYRLNTNGSLDTTFNNTGKYSLTWGTDDKIQEVLLQADEKIIGVGDVYGLTNAYTSIGAIRLTFNAASNAIIGNGIATNDFFYYPNPFNDRLHLSINPCAGDIPANYKIYTLSGLLLESGVFTTNHIEINSTDWQSGAYILEVSNAEKAVNYFRLLK